MSDIHPEIQSDHSSVVTKSLRAEKTSPPPDAVLPDSTDTRHHIVSEVKTPENVANKEVEVQNSASIDLHSLDDLSINDEEDNSVIIASKNKDSIDYNASTSKDGGKQSNDTVASRDKIEEIPQHKVTSNAMHSQKELGKPSKSLTMECSTSTMCTDW